MVAPAPLLIQQKKKKFSKSSVQVRRPYSWSKPAMSRIKFNVDADVGQSRAAVAIVVRNIVACVFKSSKLQTTPSKTKLRHGLRTLLPNPITKLSFSKVIP